MKRPPTKRPRAKAAPTSPHEQMLLLCEIAERTRERSMPAPLPLPSELDPAVEEAYEQIDRAVAALVRLLVGSDGMAIAHAKLVMQAIDAAVLAQLERAYGAADDPQARRNIIVALGLLRRQGVPRAGFGLLRIGRRESDEGLVEAVLVQLNDSLAASFRDRRLRTPTRPPERLEGPAGG